MTLRVRIGLGVCLVGLTSAVLVALPAHLDAITAAQRLMRELEPHLTKEGVTNARHIYTRLGTLKTQFAATPAPVACELGEWYLASAGAWSACSAAGVQTRQETWMRDILVVPANGGAACDVTTETRTATQPCTPPAPEPTPTPQPPTTGNAHDYYTALAPSAVKAYSLRDEAQLAQYAATWPDRVTRDFTYKPQADPDPRKQDAAKLVIPSDGSGGGSGGPYPVNPLNRNSIYQMRLPMPVMELGHSYLVTWDVWYGAEWRESIAGIPAHKAFQFDGPDRMNGSPKIWWEVHHAYKSVGDYPVSSTEVARMSVRHYGSPMKQTADGTWFGVPVGPNVTSGSTSVTPITPYRQWNIRPERWVRYWQLIEYGMDGWRSDPAGTRMTLWVADEDRDPVLVYDRLQVTLYPPGVKQFWIEFNTSTNEVKAGRPNLVAYLRNVLMLKDVPYSGMAPLLVKPVR